MEIKNIIDYAGRSLLIYLVMAGIFANILILPKVLNNGSISIDSEVVYIKAGGSNDRS
jgi:hypothetical protein